jgi:hypothetical protein
MLLRRIIIFIGCLIITSNSFKSIKKEKNARNIVGMIISIAMLITSVTLLVTE